ncbi:polysaccharide deacetylase family protein [Nonomuraea sp. NBC_01738]|uniref:polysaccharide deacetylase family protein n=1 Tax=Nonomuraea sp. NBC_01738 TaxID=2976003 RepID=UPI002E135963|nr:polysaccharide deacetylase family protein [Nonomuraea sp. NBC_01738]
MKARVSMPYVLMYHSVENFDEDPYLITVTPARFAAQMNWLAKRGLRGVAMRELLPAGRSRGLVGLTFDDGYADFTAHALPVLLRHGFTATVFAVAGQLGLANDWDRRGPRKKLMTGAELRQVAAAGMEIGSHTLTHRSLTGAPAAEVEHEVKASKVALEEALDLEISGFAYPYGHHDDPAVDAVRAAGYTYACAIRPAQAGPHTLPRTYIGEHDRRLRMTAKRLRHRWTWR